MFTDLKSVSPQLQLCNGRLNAQRDSLWVICSQRRLLQDRMKSRTFWGGTVQLHSHQRWYGFGRQLTSQQKPPPPPALTVTPDLYHLNVSSTGCCVVLLGRAGRVSTRRTSQRSSERFWIASATAVRRSAMTERGSSLLITALPDTIMLAPAWSIQERSLQKPDVNFRLLFA